ncbi:MAG: hypothetical protein RMM29_00190 [Planctomycetota bacterium]|nr:hypothetical protein [Planctomycetota bacterium]MDW8372053.1 hypothetical protein [Planctomycetota bacterium]
MSRWPRRMAALRSLLAALLSSALAGEEPAPGPAPLLLYAFYDRTRPCCATAALAGIAHLREALGQRQEVALLLVDVTPGATPAEARAAAAAAGLADAELRCDPQRALAASLGIAIEGAIVYGLCRPGEPPLVLRSPAEVQRALAR